MQSSTAAEPPRLGAARHILIALFWLSLNFHWGGMLTVLLPAEILKFVPEAQKELWLSLVTATGALVAMVAAPLAGALSDRSTNPLGRRRPFIVWGTLLNAAALLAMAYSPVIGLFALSFLVVQFANNWANGPYSGLLPDLVPAAERGAAAGWMGLMTMVGTIVAVLLAGPMVEAGRTLEFYYLMAAVMLVGMAVTVLWVREQPLTKAAAFDLRAFVRSFWIDPRRYPDFAWVFLTRFLVMLGFYSVLPFLMYFLRDVIQVPNYAAATSQVAGVVMVGATLSTLAAGWLSDRVGRKIIVSGSGLLMMVTAVAWIFTPTLPLVLAFAAVFGLGYGAYTAVDWALAIDVLPSKEHAAAKDLGIWGIAIVLPQVIAPAIGGPLIYGFNQLTPGLGYQALLALAALYTLLGSIWVWRIKGAR